MRKNPGDQNKVSGENAHLSEREQAAQAERDIAQERYRDLAEGIDHGVVWEADAETLQFCMVSRRAEEMLGYSVEEWCMPDFWAGHLHPEDRERVIRLFEKALLEGQDQSMDHRFIAADGRTVWFHTGVHAAEGKDKRVYRGLSVEITYLKEIQEKLIKKTAEAEEANRFKSQILSIVSHEIRTPLNAILGYSGLLKSPAVGEDKTKQREMIDRIYRNAQILLDFINTILDLNKIEAGKMVIQIEEISLSEILREVVSNLRSVAEEKGLQIVMVDDPTVPPIRSDPGRIWHIFTNLISNAIKFTHNGSITVRIINYFYEKRVSVIFSDTGIGMPEKDLSKIFEPFYQVDLSASNFGTGLGLSIVKKSVELLNGKIEVTSELNVGSTFEISLPYHLSEG
jgi:PAS domain S-box-containing protein